MKGTSASGRKRQRYQERQDFSDNTPTKVEKIRKPLASSDPGKQ